MHISTRYLQLDQVCKMDNVIASSYKDKSLTIGIIQQIVYALR